MDQPYDSGTQITPASYSHMASMGGWIKFISITLIILFSLLGVLFLFLGVLGAAAGGGGGIIGVMLMLIILGLGIWLMVVLLKSGTAFGNAARSHSPYDIENAFRNQKVYFIVVGILGLLGAVINLISLVTGSAVGGMNSLNSLRDFF